MLSQDKLKRISHLANKAKSKGLTTEEKKEQQSLREAYLKAFRSGFKEHLHTIKVVDPNGDDVTPEKLKRSKKDRSNLKH